MNCPKCNHPVANGHVFCINCGEKIQPIPNQTHSHPGVQLNQQMPIQPAKPRSIFPGCLIAGGVAAVVAIVIIVVIVIFSISGSDSNQVAVQNGTSSTQQTGGNNENTSNTPADVSEDKEVETVDISENINAYIDFHSNHSDVAVAVIDCNTDEMYFSKSADSPYSAWGFYLPIYVANILERNTEVSGILSSDPAVCNISANQTIESLGGLNRVNSILRDSFSCTATSFGRKFGEPATNSDNYTNATEAVQILNYMHKYQNYSLMSYNPSSFGINYPDGARVYSQIGTENRSVRKNLNVFAVVEGDNSTYCIAVLTRNGKSAYGLVDDIMQQVHSDMEGIYR